MKTHHDNILSHDLTVTDLYAELAEVRAREAEEALRLVPPRAALAWAADCLFEGVAHLRTSGRHLRLGDERRLWLESLAADLISVAGQFEHEADVISGPARA